MAATPSEQEFEEVFWRLLEVQTEKCVAVLQAVASEPPPEEVKILCFEVHPSLNGFSINIYGMDDEAPDQPYFKPPFTGQIVKTASPFEPDGPIDVEAYEAVGIATFKLGTEWMMEWFADCWHTAGGADYPIPVYVNLHDSDDLLDLQTRDRVDFADVWP